MKISFTDDFFFLLNEQVKYISLDKPIAAKKFKNELIFNLKKDLKFPYNFKKSIYFDQDSIRDYVFKGYTIVYEVNQFTKNVAIFQLIKYKNTL